MKNVKKRAIRVAKRSAGPPSTVKITSLVVRTSVATSVNNWITERRENSLSENTVSRKTFSGWNTDPKN